MTGLILHPLLKGDDLVGAIIFFAIWAVIAILSQIGKWQERKKQREQRIQVPPPPPPVPGEQPRPLQQRPKPQLRPGPARRVQPPPSRPTQSPAVQRPVLPAELRYESPPAPITRIKGEVGSSTEKASRPPVVTAREIRGAMKPWPMRKQFIILELIQPPLAMREPRPGSTQG